MQFKLLAIGVAVAACFTSVANADNADPNYYEGKGNLIEKHQNTNTKKERILGGWYIEKKCHRGNESPSHK